MSDIIQKMKGKIRELSDLCQEQKEFIESLGDSPLVVGTVVSVSTEHIIVALGGSSLVRMVRPRGVKFGSTVYALEDGQVVEVADPGMTGPVLTANSENKGGYVEVNSDGGARYISCDPKLKIKIGDRLITDGASQVVCHNQGQEEDQHKVSTKSGILWEDIGGLSEAKNELRQAVEVPFQNSKLYAAYGKSPTKGVLLYGPPGCGKTMMAKAVVTSLANTHGEFHPSAFIYVKGAELLNKWVGETEGSVRRLFARARQHKEKHGYPAVIFIDEAEALLGRRGSREFGLTSTVVPMFLAEMDGLEDSSCIMLLSTNRPDALDPAVVRDGRIDVKVNIPRPDEETARAILSVHLKLKKLKASEDEMINMVIDDLFNETNLLSGTGVQKVPFRAILNGAMLKGIIEKSCDIALTRDIADGKKKPSGINLDDLKQALVKTRVQNQGSHHRDAIEEWGAELAAKAISALH